MALVFGNTYPVSFAFAPHTGWQLLGASIFMSGWQFLKSALSLLLELWTCGPWLLLEIMPASVTFTHAMELFSVNLINKYKIQQTHLRPSSNGV